MKKCMIIICLMMMMMGCQASKPTVDIYTLETCRSCQMVKESLGPKLIDEGYQVNYMDVDEHLDDYHRVLDQLDNVDVSMYDYPMTPLIVYPSYFAFTGYDPSMDETIIQMMDSVNNDRPYQPLVGGFWTFIKGGN